MTLFPWLKTAKDLERKTLIIEVFYHGQLILKRYIHVDRFYKLKYPQIMLEIVNAHIQADLADHMRSSSSPTIIKKKREEVVTDYGDSF